MILKSIKLKQIMNFNANQGTRHRKFENCKENLQVVWKILWFCIILCCVEIFFIIFRPDDLLLK